MCWRLLCPFRGTAAPGDEITNILIFGVTGTTGGAVLDAALGCAWFKVSGFTRANHGVLYEELISKGVTVYTGDMNKPHTLAPAMKDIDIVFLVTTYWESMNVDREYMQGVNVVNTALDTAVKHLIYLGTDYSILTATERCKYLEGKAKIENYIVSVGIPFTIVQLGFYYENFLSVFKPHPTGKNEFAIALPMGSKPLNCGSVCDYGQCIAKIALRPHFYMFKTVKLATAYLSVTEIALKFDRHFAGVKFYNPKIPLSAYRQFSFEGAEEIATMFSHYRTMAEWDRSVAVNLIPSCKSFEQWMKDNDKILLDTLGEQLEKDLNLFRSKSVKTLARKEEKHSSWTLPITIPMPFSSLFEQRFTKSGKSVPQSSLLNQESQRQSLRLRTLSLSRELLTETTKPNPTP